MSKRTLLGIVLSAVMMTFPFALFGQDNGNATDQQAAPSATPEHHGRHFDPQRRTEMLTSKRRCSTF
jgi:hypothetical protein